MWRDILQIIGERFAADSTNSRLNNSKHMLASQGPGSQHQRTATSHPKMDKLLQVVQEHFTRHRESETRVIIFSQYRECVTELVACLTNLRPLVRAMPFIGQAGANGRKGLTQKDQLEVVRRFQGGGYNTLVSTCVGEEGLDIGEVDLIVLYDVASSPIRLVQRMGRTGRKREGRVVVLLTPGREESKFNQTVFTKNAINKAILEPGRLEPALWPDAPRMIPRGLNPVCQHMTMVQEKWEGPKGKVTAGAEGVNSLMNFVKKTKDSKDDLFRRNCGFLTEEEEKRWTADVRWEGEVRGVGARGEYWAGRAELGEGLRMEDWLGWQGGRQARRFVVEGGVAATFRRMLARCQGRREGEEVHLVQQVEEVQEVVEIQDVEVDELEEKNQPVRNAKASGQKSRSKSGSQARGQGSILSYFKTTPAKPGSKGVEDVRKEKVAPELICIDEENVAPMDEIIENPREEVSSTELWRLAPEEEELIADLYSDLADSGYSSPPYSPSSPCSLVKLLQPPPTLQELDNFDMEAAMTRARMKWLGPIEGPVAIQAFPLEKDVSVDMFGNDSMFDCEALTEVAKVPSPLPDSGGAGVDFQLGSPEVDVEPEEGEVEQEPGEGKQQEQNQHEQDKDQLPDVSADMFSATFDLGSPILEEEEEAVPPVYHFSPQPPFATTPLILRPLTRVQPTSSASSTPLPGNLAPPAAPDLTPVAARRRVLPPAPALVATPPHLTIKESEDLFADDHGLSQEVQEVQGSKPGGEVDSLYSASELVSLLKSSSEEDAGVSKSKNISSISNTNLKTRKRLSSVFALENSQGEDTVPKKPKNDSTYRHLPPANGVSIPDDMFDDSFDPDILEEAPKPTETEHKPEPLEVFSRPGDMDQESFSSACSEDLLAVIMPPPPKASSSSVVASNSLSVPVHDLPSTSAPTSAPASTAHDCPVCNKSVQGDLDFFNRHLDECLTKNVLDEISQSEGRQEKAKDLEPLSPVLSGARKKRRLQVVSSDSDDSLVVHVGRKRTMVSSSPELQESPLVSGRQKRTREQLVHSSEDESPIVVSRQKKARGLVSQPNTSFSSEGEEESPVKPIKKKVSKRNEFFEVEAEESGEGSGDEEEGSQADKYDESFVDDDASQGGEGQTQYLRSVRSPLASRLPARTMRPITEDMFSQVPEQEDSYLEDSFCVGSQVEDRQQEDTLDILERRAEMPPPAARSRRRIMVRPQEDTVMEQQQEEEESQSLLAFDLGSPILEEEAAQPLPPSPNPTSQTFLQPQLQATQEARSSLVVSSGEVTRAMEVVSLLKHKHRLTVVTRRCEEAHWIVGRQCAVIRIGEVEFGTGALKDRLVQKVTAALALYSRLVVVVEWEKVRSGERAKTFARTKAADTICSQLALAGVRVLYSASQAATAATLAGLVEQEENRAGGLPRGLKPTVWQEEMVQWLLLLPGLGLGEALVLAHRFPSLRDLVLAPASVLETKGGLAFSLAFSVAAFCRRQFRPDLTDMAPLN